MQKRSVEATKATANKANSIAKGAKKSGSDSNGNAKITKEFKSPKGLNWINILAFVVLHGLALYATWNLYKTQTIQQNTLILTVALYLVTAFSLSAGYHRLYAHATYQAFFLYRLIVLMFGASSFLGSVTSWCRFHRAHHRFLNTQLDPMNIRRGFLYAHFGWRFVNQPVEHLNKEVDVSDVEKDTLAKIQASGYLLFAPLFGFVLPAVIAAQWGDTMGGLLYAGAIRIILIQHAFSLTASWSHTFGIQKFTDENSARDSGFVSLLTLGEGNQSFNHSFPKDYRLGIKFYDLDPTKWVIFFLSYLGITYRLAKTNDVDILKTSLLFKQRKLNEKKSTLDFGPEEDALPYESWDSIAERVKAGKKLIVIDGIVHDATDFIGQHPGGKRIMEARVGKDATIAFNGGLYRHSKAARNILATLRVSRLPEEEANARMDSDYFRSDNE